MLADRVMFVDELPVAHVRFNSLSRSRVAKTPSTGVGDPYFGLKVHSADVPLFMEVGFRPPTTGNPGVWPSTIGSLTALKQLGAYTVNQIPFQFAGNYYFDPARPAFSARLRTGAEAFFPCGRPRSHNDGLDARGSGLVYRPRRAAQGRSRTDRTVECRTGRGIRRELAPPPHGDASGHLRGLPTRWGGPSSPRSRPPGGLHCCIWGDRNGLALSGLRVVTEAF